MRGPETPRAESVGVSKTATRICTQSGVGKVLLVKQTPDCSSHAERWSLGLFGPEAMERQTVVAGGVPGPSSLGEIALAARTIVETGEVGGLFRI